MGLNLSKKRILQEQETIEKMINIYCQARHRPKSGLCPACEALREYAAWRLTHCCFGESKPVCEKCPIHCYQKGPREQITAVMRYAGPRMLYKHPWIALQHSLRALQKNPVHKPR